MALSLVLLIISTAIMCSFSVCRVAEKSYKPSNSGTISSVMNNGQTDELSEFDAWVEYSIVLDALDGDSEQEYRLGNVYLSTENVMRLEQLADIKSKASNGVFISIVLLVACMGRRCRRYNRNNQLHSHGGIRQRNHVWHKKNGVWRKLCGAFSGTRCPAGYNTGRYGNEGSLGVCWNDICWTCGYYHSQGYKL